MKPPCRFALAAGSLLIATSVNADEHLFGYVKGAEPLPAGAMELYQWITVRDDKSVGDYTAINYATEFEYGVTNRFSAAAYVKGQSIDVKDILVDGYLPGDKQYDFKFSGLELEGKYNFLSAAKDPIGLTMTFALDYDWLDPHSGQHKDTESAALFLALQKYFLDGALIWVGNGGLETTYADRHHLSNLPEGFDWPTDPEMEIELIFGTGLSYRFAPNWFFGGEVQYETEHETEVGQERWSWFGGPSLHYGGKKWWFTATWFPQIHGGGEQFEGQNDDYHLVEKTRDEYRLKVGINFS